MVFVAALLIHAALLFTNLDLLPVWGDEQFTLNVCAAPWGKMAGLLARDIHPPLYYAAAKLWLAAPAPGEEIVRLRALSGVGGMAALALFWALWLRWLPVRVASVACGLWVMSPLLLLYFRMGRSYSWQTASVLLAIWAAARWLEAPALRDRWLAFSASALGCLYIHYLPGLAVCGAVGAMFALRWARERTIPWRPVAAAFALIALGYLPWLGVLSQAVGRVVQHERYAVAQSSAVDLAVRIGYWVVALFGGETAPLWALGLLVVAAPLGLVAGLAGWRANRAGRLSSWPIVAGGAVLIGFAGTAAWVAVPFTPARLLFAVPFVVLLAARGSGLHPRLGAGLLLLLAAIQMPADINYFNGSEFLNPGYVLDMKPLAAEVRARVGGEPILVLADGYNLDPLPLEAELPATVPVESMRGEEWHARVAGLGAGGRIYCLRPTRDISADDAHAWLDAQLAERCGRVDRTALVPNSQTAQLAVRWLGLQPLAAERYEWIRCTVER